MLVSLIYHPVGEEEYNVRTNTPYTVMTILQNSSTWSVVTGDQVYDSNPCGHTGVSIVVIIARRLIDMNHVPFVISLNRLQLLLLHPRNGGVINFISLGGRKIDSTG